MGALRYKQTKTSNDSWEPAKQAIPDADSHADAYAYQDTERNSYKLPHHFLNEDGFVGDASTKACQQAIAYLNSEDARKAMSDEDIAAAYNHLAAHLRDAKQEAAQLNGIEQAGSHLERISIEANALEDDENGTLSFPGGQVLMDGQELRSGLSYDMETMDYSEFNGTVTVDHDRRIQSVVAKTKMYMRGDELVIDSLQFAIGTSALAILAYDLYRNGFAKDLSIETYGPWPNEDGKFNKAKVIGLSLVVVGNSKAARMNSEMQQIVANSLAQAKANNLDVADLEQELGVKAKQSVSNNHKEETVKTVKNSQTFAVTVKYKNAAGDEAENSLAAGATIDVAEDQAEAVENQIKNAVDPANAPLTAKDLKESLNKALEERDAKHAEQMEELKKTLAANNSQEPTWRPTNGQTKNASGKLADMDWRERTGLQLQSLVRGMQGDDNARRTARAINELNFEELQKEGIVPNALDMGDLGNFIIPRQMVLDIKERTSNYRPIVDAFNFEETMSLETAWLTGTGEIVMSDVDMDQPSSGNGDLKPISSPTFDTEDTRLKEFAAITPIKTSVLRFAAVDLAGHISKLYRRAYDRALAQSVIGRLEQAVDTNGNSVPYDYSGGSVEALISMLEAYSKIAEHSPNGLFMMTESSRLNLVAMALRAGSNGPWANLFTDGGDGPKFLSKRYVIAPSDLMPSLNTNDVKTFTFEGETVNVNHGIFLADPEDFVGKVSGGLNFQVSDVAMYETETGGRSAFQRDELVFRGFGYRASGLYFPQNVSGVTAPGIS